MRTPIVTRFSGILDAENLKPSDINIHDIAHSLAMQCRYNGYTSQFYSVAEHCCILAEYALKIYPMGEQRYNMARALLLHDASEAYIGDITHHVKEALPKFKLLETKIMDVILAEFNMTDFFIENEKLISTLDKGICIDEMKAFRLPVDPWLSSFRPLMVPIIGLTPVDARNRFLMLADHLNLKETVH